MSYNFRLNGEVDCPFLCSSIIKFNYKFNCLRYFVSKLQKQQKIWKKWKDFSKWLIEINDI